MTKETYYKIVKIGFLDRVSGNVNNHFINGWHDDLTAKLPEVRNLISMDINKKFDLNNLIILLDTNRNFLIGADRIVSTHAADIVDLRKLLHKNGIKYKNGEKMIDRKYGQTYISKLIIEDGVAYAFRDNLFHEAYSKNNFGDHNRLPIEYDSENLNFENKEVVFSGILLHNYKS